MKRITLALTLALGCMMTTQSFGFDLLDRMLGSKGCGCDTACCADPSCGSEAPCCAADPACGCEAPSCGCDSGCGLKGGLLSGLKGCGSKASCGCESACPCEPACGAESACCDSGCDSGCGIGKNRGGLLKKLFSRKCGKGCDSGCEPACGAESACGCAAPACGCDAPSCDSGCGCGSKRGGLLSKLFGGCKSSSSCDMGCDSGCGCGSSSMAPTMAPEVDSAPEAPAPIVDPSAYNQGKRRVVQASARYVR